MEKVVTVQENAENIIDHRELGKAYSWAQINRLAESLWDDRNKLEFIGVIRGKQNGKMYCVFQELIRNSNNTFKPGAIYKVENDVVFEFQKNKQPVKILTKVVVDSEMID